jgi:agmatine/peptidylarginine deiminase
MKNFNIKDRKNASTFFPPEWHSQSAVQLTWPHENTDWKPILKEATECFVGIAREIVKRERLIIVAPDISLVRDQLGAEMDTARIIFREMPTDDTWARDHGGISVFRHSSPVVCDFRFNGWGMKFPAENDNRITRRLFADKTFAPDVNIEDRLDFVLEGGGIETNGAGVLLATSRSFLSINRNEPLTKSEIEERLKYFFGIQTILWLDNGYLAGDDTDGHIDTLARFCSEDTIAYVKCSDENDEHFDALKKMENELKGFTRSDGRPYRLHPLPMADKVVVDGERLPATYANFLIINNAVLMPAYNSPKDEIAGRELSMLFPEREIIQVNCLPLIRQHGSLHCVTMQYPEGFVE